MLDPSILVSPDTHHGQVNVAIPDARGPIELVQEAESRTQTLAVAIELLAALDATENLDDAAREATRLLCEVLSATRVLVLWRHRSGRGLSVLADSDDAKTAMEVGSSRLVLAAGEELAARDVITQWPPTQVGLRHAMMAIEQFAQSISTTSLVGICLSDSNGRDRGVVLAIDPANPVSTNFLRTIGPPLAGKLIGIGRLQPTSLERGLRSVVDMARGSRRNLMLSIVIALGIVMALPVRYKIGADLVLQPVKHRFIAVPIGGPLESARVRPGDMVQQGELLATINPREIEYELASIRAELNRALQQKKQLMAQHDVAGSKIAALDSDRLRLQSDLMEYRRDNLEIRSPIAGVVVSGDLKQSEGMPMSRGETLFEIAPLSEMVVEIAVPEDDVAHVGEGRHVDFYVHALPNLAMNGTIARLHPRAELRNHDNVYIAEVRVNNPNNVLRPGMRGRAKICSDRHPLGWNLFHKAYFALRRTVGW